MKITATQNFINKVTRPWVYGTLLQKDLKGVNYKELTQLLKGTYYEVGTPRTQEIASKTGGHILKLRGVCGSTSTKLGLCPNDLNKTATLRFNSDGDLLQIAACGKDSQITVGQVLRTQKAVKDLKQHGIDAKLITHYEKRTNRPAKISDSNSGMIYKKFGEQYGMEFPENYN